MGFKEGDKVKVTTKNSMHEGKTGKIVRVYEDNQSILVTLEQGNLAGMTTGFFASELELVDERREALIELAETLDKARLQANAIEATADQRNIYGSISVLLVETLCLMTGRYEVGDIYDALLDGNTVREALKAVEA